MERESSPIARHDKRERRTGPTVLVAEDNEVVRQTLLELIREWGFEVVGEARDGAEAAEMARRLRPGVVLIDMKMPRMDGVESTKLILRDLPNTRVIMVSAYDDPGLRRDAEEAGVWRYILKGSPASIVLEAIAEAGRKQDAEPAA